jgi:tight adherence protein B
MNIFIGGIVIFVMSVFIIEMSFYAYDIIKNPNRKKIRKRLKAFTLKEDYSSEEVDILKKRRVLSDVPLLDRILSNIPGILSLDRLLQQANAQYPLGVFILFTCILVLVGYLVFSVIMSAKISPVIIAFALGGIPLFYLRFKKRRRMKKFQEQLPEGLELIARALKAGHAFTTGVKLAADEFSDPLGPEFEETLNEINFGIGVPDALKNLVERVDCQDLKFFVISVILQRETGGNLAEIMESLAQLIRERFKLQGKIRILSAEGRLTAIVLLALPFFIATALYFVNPEYMNILFSEPAGRMMGGIALFMMAVGAIIMKMMINIKV